jgi:hypothetical protein
MANFFISTAIEKTELVFESSLPGATFHYMHGSW